jgi:hypothetical protein
MAFNFFSGGYTSPRMMAQNQMYQDPRMQGAMGSFNPSALEFGNPMAALMKSADSSAKPAPAVPPPAAPQVPTIPPSTPPSSGSYKQPGTPPPMNQGPISGGTPVPKPTGTPGASGGSGGFNYTAYPTLQALYAAHPGGLPPNFDMQAWANATGNQAVMNQSTSGDPLQFTWNPDGPGYINPMNGETFDRPGETYPYTPPPRTYDNSYWMNGSNNFSSLPAEYRTGAMWRSGR